MRKLVAATIIVFSTLLVGEVLSWEQSSAKCDALIPTICEGTPSSEALHRDCVLAKWKCAYITVCRDENGVFTSESSCFLSDDIFNYQLHPTDSCRFGTRSCNIVGERCTWENDDPLCESDESTDTPTYPDCDWLENYVDRCSEDEIVVFASRETLEGYGLDSMEVTSETARIDRTDVPQFESRMNTRDGRSIKNTIVRWALEDEGMKSDFARWLGNYPNPYTYKAPRTRAFFNNIDNIPAGSSECETMKQVYEAVTSAVTRYGIIKDNPMSHFGTFEEVLESGGGICRDRAALLSAALRRRGVDARIIRGTSNGSTHSWVRVTLSESEGMGTGREIDLDPTYYQSFVPLEVRDPERDPDYCR